MAPATIIEDDPLATDVLRVGNKIYSIPPAANEHQHNLSQFDAATQTHIQNLLTRINPQAKPKHKWDMGNLLIEFHDIFARAIPHPH